MNRHFSSVNKIIVRLWFSILFLGRIVLFVSILDGGGSIVTVMLSNLYFTDWRSVVF